MIHQNRPEAALHDERNRALALVFQQQFETDLHAERNRAQALLFQQQLNSLEVQMDQARCTAQRLHDAAAPARVDLALQAPVSGGAVDTPTGVFLESIQDGQIPTWAEIVEVVAAFKAQAKAKMTCSDADCCQFGQSRCSCPCAEDDEACIAADLFNVADKAEKAHRSHEFKALRLQMNDKTGFFA